MATKSATLARTESAASYPRWPAVWGTVVCALGIADGAYLTYAHFTTASVLACPRTAFINCDLVTTSAYSHFLGLPVAVLGLAYFLGMLPFQLPVAWRSQRREVRLLRLLGSVVGILMVFWLLYAELVKLDAICLFCSLVHLITFILFVVTVLGTMATSRDALAA